MTSIEDYIATGHKKIPGWFSPVDMHLFALANLTHRKFGVSGNVLEIGAYKGRSAILLGYMLAPGENLVVCDLFQQEATSAYSSEENEQWYRNVSPAHFEANYLRYHSTLPEIVVGPSTVLRDRCRPASCRLVHLDGSHIYDDVMNDLLLSRDLVIDSNAIVAIDDINAPHTPGVAAAAWRCVFSEGLVPLVVSDKMYATWREPSHSFTETLRDTISAHPQLLCRELPIGERVVLQVSLRRPRSPRSRAKDVALRMLPPKALDKLASRRHL